MEAIQALDGAAVGKREGTRVGREVGEFEGTLDRETDLIVGFVVGINVGAFFAFRCFEAAEILRRLDTNKSPERTSSGDCDLGVDKSVDNDLFTNATKINSRVIRIYISMNKKSMNLPVSTRAKVMTEETNLILVLLTKYKK